MSHSVVKDFPTQTDNTLILVVNKNGELSVDKETLDGYAKLGNSQVSILRVDNDEGSTVDMTLDTFHPTDTMEELTISVEDEIIRNYNSFRMDHCYTPLTSPSQQKPPIPPIDDDLELDDLAHTLSILDGSEPIPAKIKPKISEHLPKDPHPKVEIQNSDNNKVTLLNKVNKLGVNNKVYKSVKTVLKGAKVIKKPPEIHPPLDSDSEDDDDDDDLNDSDFELDDSPVKKQSRRPVVNKRRSKLDHDLHNDVRNKVIKVRKGVRPIVYKASGTPQKLNQAINVADTKVEAVIPPQSPQTHQTHQTPQTNQTPQTLQTPQPSDTIKSPETKKQPKKEKKIPKQIDDGIALFSTPDIIRRVGKSGEKLLSDGSESPTKVKPAKIEDRSKSESGRHSTETKIKHAHRHSLDSRPSAGGQHVVVDKPKVDAVKHHNERERRMSNVSDKSSDLNSFNNSGSTHDDVITNHNESFDSISEAVGNLENIIGAGATPTTDMIRSIIHTNEPAIIDTTSTPTATPIATATASNIIATPVDIVQSVVDSPVVDQAQLNLDNTALDIDQNILDNINADELIPEDILYQVAKLVENPDVQNVIDRTLVNLEPTIQAPLTSEQQQQQSMAVAHAPIQSPSSVTQHVQVPLAANSNSQPVTPKNSPKPIQIIRSDGRVVTLPPIEKPATRSSKKKQETQVVQSPVVQLQQPPPPVQLPPPSPPQPVQAQPQPVVLLPQLVQPAPKIQPVPPKVQKPLALPLADEFIVDDAAAGDGDTDSDESWNSEDDPDRLWCICKQPHNNRFMICCDTCEDWFHGKCVNVTKAMGQQMEQQGKEWQCPNCVKKVNASVSSSTSSNPNPNVSHPRPARIPPDSIAKRKSTEAGPSCIVCSSAARANSVYCSDACILKHAQGVEKETNKAQKSAPQRIIVFERSTGKCLSGPNAPTANNLKQWLREHPGFEVVRPVNKTKQQNQNLVQSKLQLVKNPHGKEGVGLAVQRKGVQVGVLPHAAKQPNTIKLIPPTKMVPGAKTPTPKQPTQQTSPNKKLVQTTLKSPPTPSASTPTTVTPDKPKPVTPTSKSKVRERKQKLQTPETPRQNAQENIRETVKKTLLEQLLARLKEVEDIKLGEDEVDKMATEIETQLYKLFGDSGPKYRAKYRSLIFNIKDPKNQTLWRRICEKSISPHQLVRLSPEEMASQELARWREQENKHQLDMIKKSELEMLTINRKYVLKTHKGEQVMEDRPSVKVDSTEIMPGLGADSTSEHDTTLDKEKSDHNSDHSTEKRSSSKHSRRDRDRDKRSNKEKARDRSKDHNTSKSSSSRSKRSRSRDRDKDRDRSSHKSDRKRSRSRDRHHRSSHKSSRHKREKHSTEHLDKKSREILDNLENNKIVPPPEDRLWKHVPQQDIQEITPDSDSDHEPTSTVTIPTPPRSTDQEDTTQHALKKEEPVINTAVVAPLPTLIKAELKVETVLPPRSDPRVNREAATSVETPPESECSQPQTTPTLSSNNSNNSPSPALTNTAIWEGHINMADVAKFFISLHEVSGDCVGLDSELTSTLDIVGRITPDTVWDYIGKMKRSNSKLISVLRLTAGNVEEQMQYIALFTYLSNRKRFGVIKTPNSAIKDFYIMPLASHTPIPQALLPLSGPGFKENRPDLLLGIVVRAKRKRPNPIDIISSGPSVKRSRLEDSPNISQTSVSSTPAQQPPRSYTPPPTRDPRIRLPTIPAVAATLPNDDDEPYSPEDSDPESIPVILQKTTKPSIGSISSVAAAAAINIKTADIASVLSATTKSTSFLETSSAVSSFEPFSNKFDGIPGLDEAPPTNAALIQKQLEELNKCIEQQKDEINSISQNLASTASTSVTSNLSNINLPSNLQQILDSIKNIPSTNVAAQDTEEYCPTAPGYKTAPGDTDDLTIPLMLPKLSSRTQSSRPPPAPSSSSSIAESLSSSSSSSTIPLKLPLPSRGDLVTELPNLSVPPPAVSIPNTHIPPPSVVIPNMSVPPPLNTTIPLNLPKNKVKSTPPPPALIQPPGTSPVIIPDAAKPDNKPLSSSSSSVLSSLSEEELIRKAAEMLGEAEDPEKDDSPEPSGKTAAASDSKYPGASQSVKCAPVMYTAPSAAVAAATSAPPTKRTKIDPSQPPVPGLEDEFET